MISNYVLLTKHSLTLFKSTSDAFDGYDAFVKNYVKEFHKIPMTKVIIDKKDGSIVSYGDQDVAVLLPGIDDVLRRFKA